MIIILDFRHETFFVLCKIKNYTKTAEFLHITQPAVTQHIKFLEKHYNVKLFYYEKRTLSLTNEGKILYDFVITMSADSKKIKQLLSQIHTHPSSISFGATLTIGEYVMPEILTKLINKYPNLNVTMLMDNTQVLLQKLHNGEIDFIILEGFFDKSRYDSEVFSLEYFIPVCSNKSSLKDKPIKFSEILNHRIILREKGSGTRNIFEQILYKHNLTIESFKKICEIGNMNVIKQLVKKNLGVTFLYKAAVQEKLLNEELCEMNIIDFSAKREFNFIFLKNSIQKKEYLNWFKLLKNLR